MADGIDSTLHFWFGPLTTDGVSAEDRLGLWFGKSDDQDATIREQFGPQVEQALAGELDNWAATKAGRMALVLTLDQFTRNIHRGTPRAFAGDSRALQHALHALDQGEDAGMPLIHRVFLYLPLEHAEDLAIQERCVRCFQALESQAPEAAREMFRSFTDYAEQHRDVIRRFGRFPHRNGILGRESTPDERAYLAQPGAGF